MHLRTPYPWLAQFYRREWLCCSALAGRRIQFWVIVHTSNFFSSFTRLLRPSATRVAPSVLMASANMKVITDNIMCPISAEAFCALRGDFGFTQYTTQNSDPPSVPEVVSLEVDEAAGKVTRVQKITALKNPIPSLLRSSLGCKGGFVVRLTETWPLESSSNAKCCFTSVPPVLADSIKIWGEIWAEARGPSSCEIFMSLSVQCSVKGAGAIIVRQPTLELATFAATH